MSNLPLYREVRENPPIHDPRKPQGHSGLWFERFYDRYHPEFTDTKNDDDAFKDWLKTFDHRSGESELLDGAIERQALLIGALGGQFAVFKSDWHFVSGMGYPHPLENGFNWHPVWGVPYLSGASLKGLVRAWVEAWEFEDNAAKERKEKLRHWFGSESKDGDDANSQNTGEVIFFDAIPMQPVNLTADIMTPHMGDWYAKGGEISDVSRDADKIPADWHSPKPIYFLSAREPTFLVSVAPRNEQVAANIDLDEVMECVALALEWLGAGAKTAVGYGQMRIDKRASRSLNHAIKEKAYRAEVEKMPEQQQKIAELQKMLEKDKSTGNKAAGNPTNQKLLALIKQAKDWDVTDKRKLADLGEEIFNYIGWGKGKKKRERKAMFSELRSE